MIRYALRCAEQHEFESWFRDSGSFDEQKGRGLVQCPLCGSASVEKALMAPAVVASRSRAKPPGKAVETPTAPTALPADPAADKMRAMMRAMRDHLLQNSRDVGADFATEARRIHDEASPEAIHGQASVDQVRALADDGIDVMPLPIFPDDRN